LRGKPTRKKKQTAKEFHWESAGVRHKVQAEIGFGSIKQSFVFELGK
jgi:hypothetical protein